MSFYWQHQVYDEKSPAFDSPLELWQFHDRYFEDFICRKKSEKKKPYEGYVQTVGVRHCYPDYHFFNRISRRYSLHYILSGKGWIGKREVGAGDVIFFDRDHMHNFSADFQDPCCYAWITLQGPGCGQLLQQAGFFQKNMIFHTENLSEVCEIFYDMIYNEHPKYQADFFLESCFFKLLSLTVPALESTADIKPTARAIYQEQHIDRAMVYIQQHHKEPDFQIETIGPAIGLNDHYFRKLFKKKLGISPKQYLIQYRIEAAMTLLCSSNYSISEIATFVGFHDYRHFLDIFRSHTGITPTQFRANKSNETKSLPRLTPFEE